MTQPTLQQWLDRKPAGRKPKKPVKKRSAKRQRDAKEYTKLRKEFLKENPLCQATDRILDWMFAHDRAAFYSDEAPQYYVSRAEEVHHVEKRGKNYLKINTWLACSSWAHRWIHAHPSKARELGLLK